MTTIAVSPDAEQVGNVGVAAVDGATWVAWDEIRPDGTVRLHVASPDGPVATLQEASTLAKPSIAADDLGITIAALADCALEGCEASLGLWIGQDGAWTREDDLDLPADGDYGRPDLDLADDGSVHVCASVTTPAQPDEDLVCARRAPDGGWAATESPAAGNDGSDDHPSVLAGASGLSRVGFTSRDEAHRRRPAVWNPATATRTLLGPGAGHGEDVGVIERDGALEATWREGASDATLDWTLRRATCPVSGPCDSAGDWTEVELSGPARIDAPDLVAVPGGLVVVWTEDDALVARTLCDGGAVRDEHPDPGATATTGRGQPTVAIDGDRLHVAYAAAADPGWEVRVATRPLPVCSRP